MAMLPRKSPSATRQLSPTECFDLWLELGSLKKVSDYYTRKGVVSRVTGLPITIYGVRIAAYRWMFNNIPEAYERCKEAGSDLDYEEFRMFVLIKYVGHAMSNAAVDVWLKNNDFFDPTGERGYRAIYERKFGRIHAERAVENS